MTDAALKSGTDEIQEIIVEGVFPHAPETTWKTLTSGALMARWLMQPTGFEPIAGKAFTYQTTAAGGLGWHDPLPRVGSDPERAPRLCMDRRR